MKKSKILMPILASAGTVAAIAPMVCLTSCGVKCTMVEVVNGEFHTDKSEIKFKKDKKVTFTALPTSDINVRANTKVIFEFTVGGTPTKVADGGDISIKYKTTSGSDCTATMTWSEDNSRYEYELSEDTSIAAKRNITLSFYAQDNIEQTWAATLIFTVNA